jgi:hypothetical protein
MEAVENNSETLVTIPELNFDCQKAIKANQSISNLNITTKCIAIIGSLGAFFGSLGLYNALAAGAAVLSTAPLLVTISSIALIALSMYLQCVSNSLLLQFPESKRCQFSFALLKGELSDWPSNYHDVCTKIKEVNAPCHFVELRYDPTKNQSPQLWINSEFLNDSEKVDLLLSAAKNNIIIHFSNLDVRRGGKEYYLWDYVYECKEAVKKGEDLNNFRNSLNLGIQFFVDWKEYCQNENHKFSVEKVNQQLAALTPKIYINREGNACQPRMELLSIRKVSLYSYFGENRVSSSELEKYSKLTDVCTHINIFEGSFGEPKMVQQGSCIVEYKRLDEKSQKNLTTRSIAMYNPVSYVNRLSNWIKG